MRLNMLIIAKCIFVLLILLPTTTRAQPRYPTLFNNIEKADFIILGECIAVSKDSFDIRCANHPTGRLQGPMLATYNIIQTWKNYDGKDFYIANFESINKALSIKKSKDTPPPKTRTPYVPEVGQYAYLFIKDGKFLNNDYNGFVPVDKDSTRLYMYNNTISRLEEISRLDPVARVEALYDEFKKRDRFIWHCANIALMKMPIDFTINNFVELMSMENQDIRHFNLYNIKESMNDSLANIIMPYTRHNTLTVRNAAFSLVKSFKFDALLLNYDSYDASIRTGILKALKADSSVSFLDMFYSAADDNDNSVRAVAIELLRRCPGEKAADLIYTAFESDDPSIIFAAFKSAEKHLRPELLPHCYKHLHSENPFLSFQIMELMPQLYDKYVGTGEVADIGGMIDTLVNIAYNQEMEYKRGAAIQAVCSMDSTLLNDRLVRLLFDDDVSIREMIARRLEWQPLRQNIRLLQEALAVETDDAVRKILQAGLDRLYRHWPEANPANIKKMRDEYDIETQHEPRD